MALESSYDDERSDANAAHPAAHGEPAPPPLPEPPLVEPPMSEPPLVEPPAPSRPQDVTPEVAPTSTPPAQAGKWRSLLTSFSASLVVHLAILIVCSLMFVAVQGTTPRFSIVSWPRAESDDEPLTIVEVPMPPQVLPDKVETEIPNALEVDPVPEFPQLEDDVTPQAAPPGEAAAPVEEADTRTEHAFAKRSGPGGGIGGRSEQARSALVGKRGGTPGSENAVAMGLAWLAAHQNQNGSWHFDHRGQACQGQCDPPGTAGTTTGATALALLPFLGAGHTHQQGEYREVVKQGLYYLQGRMRRTPHGGDFLEGTMYAQGLTAIALSEAYVMTKDPELRPFAQEAIDYICYAQHPAGGWRYFPGQPGDTTVFGWQFMALKSAYLGQLEVPSPVIERAMRYLDSVQSAKGAAYGYLERGRDPTPTAVGLLSRMYIGWPHDKPELGQGVTYLAKLGPSKNDMYFNYYATQVMHHYEGPQWEKWNGQLRDYLINTQAKTGHARGSWYFEDKHSPSGGRLYTTALCVMILEVYYRHMPLYGERTVDEGF